jgi:hypothetical protein
MMGTFADHPGATMNTPPLFIDVTAPPFNAVGDGTTDDAPALQRAVDSLARYGVVDSPRYETVRGEPTSGLAKPDSDSEV